MICFFLLLLIIFIAEINGGSLIVRNSGYSTRSYLLIFIGLLLIIGLRNMSVGTDTITYVSSFLGENLGIANVFSGGTEPLYTLLMTICQSISHNYTIFLLIFALPISLSFSIYIRDYSTDYLLSTLLFMVLGIMGFCMAGLRQAIALAISLVAYRFANEKKLIPFLLACIVAFGFHNSSLVMISLYPMSKIKKVNFLGWIVVFIAFILGYTHNGIVLRVASFFFTQDRYSVYLSEYTSSMNYTLLIIQGLLLLFCYMNKRVVLENDDRDALLYIMAFLGIVFQSFTPILGEFFRLAMFFSFSLVILVPKTIYLMENDKLRNISYFGLVGLSTVYMVVASSSIFSSYVPFWG